MVINFSIVDLPSPLLPTIATIWLQFILKLRLLNKLFELYLNFTFLNSIEPFIFLIFKFPYVSLENELYEIISNTLCADTFPSANFSLISDI